MRYMDHEVRQWLENTYPVRRYYQFRFTAEGQVGFREGTNSSFWKTSQPSACRTAMSSVLSYIEKHEEAMFLANEAISHLQKEERQTVKHLNEDIAYWYGKFFS